ncbi:hypothetical protein ARMSODRAFT_1082612 [Armillaria solidipes]|uniref:F-box domain-containing protein n=1 Tax=Armillaria solidipes TaxID=1076256 RepID=A0A2H3CA22_9AGAR|nr:hypothetical protein ARMSODRAFT_1082612 [Armillaria solidipes]
MASNRESPEVSTAVDSENIDKACEQGIKPKQEKKVQPSLKKARTTNSTTKFPDKDEKKQGKRRRRDLSLLPTMPLDILFSICSVLTPRDLISLSRVDRNFCRTLTARNASFVWKAVREAEEGIEPPRGVPEYRWVDLLFGISACDLCNAKKIPVDWSYRRRICRRCIRSHSIVTSKIAKRFPGINTAILDMVPVNYPSYCSPAYYWIPAIEEIQEKIRDIEADGKPGASDRVSEFCKERKQAFEDMLKDSGRCGSWAHSYFRKRAEESEKLEDKRFSKIKEHLLELGYTERDVKGIKWKQSGVNRELTTKGWNMIRPGLEAEIQKNRVQYAKWDRSVAIYRRANIVKGLLKTYKQNFLPIVWREMPLHIDVCMFPVFKAILNRPTEDNVTEDSFADAMSELPGLIANWQQRREADLRVAVQPLLVDGVDALKLATAVFSCKGLKNYCPGHITNTGIWQHRCPKFRRSSKVDRSIELRNAKDLYDALGYHCELSFDTGRSTRMASVVQFVSRDPATTTAEEMDALGLQFVSLNSSVSKYQSVGPENVLYGRPVLSWRESYFPGCRLLTPEDESKKRQVLRQPSGREKNVFYCQHCSGDLDNSKPYEQVAGHIRDMHGIQNPRINSDLFLAPGAELPEEQYPPLYILEFEKPNHGWPDYFNY